jgi:hypothetical protein
MADRLAFKGALKASADDGSVYVIDVFEVMHDRSGDEVRDVYLYRTADGRAVRHLAAKIYEIVESGLVVPSSSEGSPGPNPPVAT